MLLSTLLSPRRKRPKMATAAADYEKQGLLHDMFTRQAKQTPDAIAVVSDGGDTMTFRELDEATDVLAMSLRIRGVKPDSIVGIYMEKCLEYVVSYIAILKAGGAYMPLDVSYPIPLLEDIFADARPVAVCADETLREFIPEGQSVVTFPVGWLETLKEENSKHRPVPPPSLLTLDNLAYTVYSSGTTGKPKGIQCPHRGAVFSYFHRHESFPYASDGHEREAANVFFVWEMLRPLLKGVPLYIVPDDVIYDPKRLCAFLRRHAITRMLFTPSLLEAVIEADGVDVAGSLKAMRCIIFCGEVVTTGLLDRCMNTLPWVRFVNLYSISEAHDVTYGDLSAWYKQHKGDIKQQKFCPVGKLLPGVRVVIMNDQLQPQPVGVAGEIYIGGPALAVGYLNRPELNTSRFIARPEGVPASAGERLYKAGDWGYMLSDGSFEICGRCDSMVKIRGYSIETQAVEAALLETGLCNACVVLVMGEEGEDKYLVAYVVPVGEATRKDIRAALKRRLPFYMIPSYFVLLSCIPILTASGKLDKKALPAVDKSAVSGSQEEATTDTERRLVPLWADVLALKAIDVQESFFDLGGHSLLATRLLNRVEETFGVQLTVKDLFIHSTVSAMARLLDNRLQGNKDGRSPLVISPALNLLKEVDRHDQMFTGMDIQLRAFWRSMEYTERWHGGRVLLTGATGFLGAFLLRDLLKLTNTHIFCVVRENPQVSGLERLRACLMQYSVLPPNPAKCSETHMLMQAKFNNRVTAIIGDVGLMNMGMASEDYMYLCTEIDFIIHAAAYVNLIYPYQALHGPNVLGTQNVVKFACDSKIKPLHYVSTDAVFPHGEVACSEDEDMTPHAAVLDDGYAQSKWVAEQLVRRAMERGLPAAIYRLGNLSGESETAYWNPADFNLLMIDACLRTGRAPDVDWDMEMTPVDFVSRLIVTLTQKMALGLGKIFHVINTNTMKSQWLFEWLTARGHNLQFVPYDEWVKCVKQDSGKLKENGLVVRLLDSMIKDESYFPRLSTYANGSLQKILKVLKMSYPELNHDLLKTYLHHLTRRRVLPPARRNTMYPLQETHMQKMATVKKVEKPLEGKVAIVTGASSGIGAACAQQLAAAGAQVAMAARREDRLKELQQKIQQDGGVAICVTCDVVDRAQVAELVRHTETALGPVDILLNNAGIMYYEHMKNCEVDNWEKQIDVNCKSVVNCVGAVLQGMLARKSGHIINMSSDAGRRGFAGLAVYSGTKFFVEGFSQGMRCELAKDGIKVTCIQPGDVKTELQAISKDLEAKEKYATDMTTAKVLVPDDIARAVVYAACQPEHVAVNEILIEPRESPI